MIKGIGIDIIEVQRIRKIAKRLGNRFVDRIFTPMEQKYFAKKNHSYLNMAAHFASKEAFAKAIGHGLSQGINWKNIQILNKNNGRPYIKINGKPLKLLKKIGAKTIHLSISHIKNLAAAIVILES